MTGSAAIVHKKYKNKRAKVRISGVIQNPQNARQTPLDFECMIDTGFSGGIMVPDWVRLDAQSIGIETSITNMTLADGSKTSVHVCVANIHKIDNHSFLLPGKATMLVMCGRRPGKVLGMDALKYWAVLFDGPRQTLTIS